MDNHTGDPEGPGRTVRAAGERDSVSLVRRLFLEKANQWPEASVTQGRYYVKVKKPQNRNILQPWVK